MTAVSASFPPGRVPKRRARMPAALTAEKLLELHGDITATYGDPATWGWRRPGAKKPTVLGFDPSERTGWAAVQGYEYGVAARDFGDIASKAIDATLMEKTVEIVNLFSPHAGTNAPLLVAVEDVFLKKNVATMAMLAYRVGALIGACAHLEVPVVRVPPSVWQRAMIGKIRRDQGKALSLARARAQFGRFIKNDHQADAALLAAFVRGPL